MNEFLIAIGKITPRIISSIVLILIASFNLYSLMLNRTNHTGFETYILMGIYAAIALSALIVLVLLKVFSFQIELNVYIIILALCLIGILNVIAFEKLNIMMKYETWLKKGIPNKFTW
jgi:hypothetical protein